MKYLISFDATISLLPKDKRVNNGTSKETWQLQDVFIFVLS